MTAGDCDLCGRSEPNYRRYFGHLGLCGMWICTHCRDIVATLEANEIVPTTTKVYCARYMPVKFFDKVFPEWKLEDKVEENKFKLETLETGAQKHLEGKLMLELVPPEMVLGLAEVLTYGAKKYEAHGWEKGIPYMTSYGAAMRHLMAWAQGVDKDAESGLNHIDQAMLNLGMIATQTRRARDDLDNRNK